MMELKKSQYDIWMDAIERRRKNFDFIKIDFLVDMRVAERKFKEEYKKDICKIRTLKIPFSQWLDMKKFEASKFHTENNKYNLE